MEKIDRKKAPQGGEIDRKMDIKNRLKAIREQKNISQNELAEILKINVYTVSKWETGVRTPDEEHLDQIAKALCEKKEYLLGLTDEIEDRELEEKVKVARAKEVIKKYTALSDESMEFVDDLIEKFYLRDESKGLLEDRGWKVKIKKEITDGQ